jgi:hypothetical protein
MMYLRSMPAASFSSFIVLPSTMSSKRTRPARSARIGMLCGSQLARMSPALILAPSAMGSTAPSGIA